MVPFQLIEMETSMDSSEFNEIDYCVVCFTGKPDYSLSNKLEARHECITGSFPVTEMGSDSDVSDSLDELENDEEADDELDNGAEGPVTASNSNDGSSNSSLNIVSRTLPSLNGVIQRQLRTFFVLKNVLGHPLEHLSTQKMMLLVQCPSDWFAICDPCAIEIDQAIKAIENLKGTNVAVCKEIYGKELERRQTELRHKFIDGFLEVTPPENWEFTDTVQMERYGDVSTTNFLLSEAESVLEFRRFLHTTAFARLQDLVSPSTPTTTSSPETAESSEKLDQSEEASVNAE